MPSKKEILELREKLLDRRREIFDFRDNVNTSWQTLHEPEKELEEAASKETLARGLEQLDERGQAEIGRIDSALAKMDEGRYGRCEGCRRSISLQRLQAVPWARHCVRCAAARENFSKGRPEARAVLTEAEALTDEEMQEAIDDALQEDGRVETEELNISCEDGVVYLDGTLPSSTQHEILLEIINDILSFDETVDNVKIDRQLWERPERTPENRPGRPAKENMIDGEDDRGDVHTSLSEGEPMTPPDKLVPEDRRSRE
jgi:RNA polymerase-binding transcription factor DksA